MPTKGKREVLLEAIIWYMELGSVPEHLASALAEHGITNQQIKEVIDGALQSTDAGE